MTRQEFISNVKVVQGAFRRFLTALCCGDSQLADDLAQEAFIKAWLAIGDCRAPEKFRAWIYRIGHTTYLNHVRSRRPSAGYDEIEGAKSPDSADGAFRYQELHSAIRLLTPAERSSILLYYMEGYSIREIAAIEECSESAIKRHLSRGRKHLKALL